MPQDAATDALTDIKRQQEVTDRPGKSDPAPDHYPAELRSNSYSGASYKLAAPKKATPKSDLQKSLDWNEQQHKVADEATK